MKNLKIKSKVFLVHKKNKGKVNGARIILGSVKTFEYRDGDVFPVIVSDASKKIELKPENYLIFTRQEDAINCLMGEDIPP